MQTRVWVTRDNTLRPDYELWWKEPKRRSNIWDCQGPDEYDGEFWPNIGKFCPEHFERLTGIQLKEGEIRECMLSLTLVDETNA